MSNLQEKFKALKDRNIELSNSLERLNVTYENVSFNRNLTFCFLIIHMYSTRRVSYIQ